ncbi:hypothetical protein OE88DRAFT_1667257 [Heliocybe sulcata]|uniref:Uncharacterized protein n=1 Tax=Heliocybe sulcata TaxID=5364 RepID=A0A5C3MS98_9AGAM|nr:hypothetical protein OE88DRAFT_1667257 [Heliocybe sulcata]
MIPRRWSEVDGNLSRLRALSICVAVARCAFGSPSNPRAYSVGLHSLRRLYELLQHYPRRRLADLLVMPLPRGALLP